MDKYLKMNAQVVMRMQSNFVSIDTVVLLLKGQEQDCVLLSNLRKPASDQTTRFMSLSAQLVLIHFFPHSHVKLVIILFFIRGWWVKGNIYLTFRSKLPGLLTLESYD